MIGEVVNGLNEGIAQGIPWSGSERNHVFFGGFPGMQFEDLSGITGIDDPSDGRSFALLDFDRDGRQDIALASAGAPRLRLLRNGIGDRSGVDHSFVAVRFVGGNARSAPSKDWSARDGFGASITLEAGDLRLYREHQPETGYIGQHSSTMIVGIGESTSISSLEVRWLSGKTQSIRDVPARQLITVYENPNQSPTGEAFVVEPYVERAERVADYVSAPDFWKTRLLPTEPLKSSLALHRSGRALGTQSNLTLVATMATWCAACVEEMPEFQALRGAFSPEELSMYGVPVDTEDTASMLEAWRTQYRPPYKILAGIEQNQVDRINAIVTAELRSTGVPAAFLADPAGRILVARWGVPSISDVKKYLWQRDLRLPGRLANREDLAE